MWHADVFNMEESFPAGDEHVIEAIGRARVVIRNGRVVEVGEPVIEDCPLARRFAVPVTAMEPGAIRANMEARIRSFGMCTPDRQVLSETDFVLFGASELMMEGLRSGLLDGAVLACDGAGTVVVSDPALVQGIGGRMSGLVRTTPYPAVIERIREAGGDVVYPETAGIDQVGGALHALDRGYGRIAVTVAGAGMAEGVRAAAPAALIIAVHTTGLSNDEAERLVAVADIATACASGTVREAARARALVQGGTGVPIFALTPRGKELVMAKLSATAMPLLVKGGPLPPAGGGCPSPLV
jgi:putative methanogenesis marker protein 8